MSKATWQFRRYAESLLSAEASTVQLRSHADVHIALVYPNSYEVGMANLGFQSLYRLLNGCGETRCERAFLGEGPLAREVRTLESGRPLREFDIVAFCLSFELDYFNAVWMLHLAGIPVLWRERGERDPLVLVGGTAVTLNPAPMMPIADLLFIGEADEAVDKIVAACRAGRDAGRGRAGVVEAVGGVSGVLAPASVGTHHAPTVCRQYVAELRAHPTFSAVVTPASHYRNMFLVEVGRGCTRGCSFCAAGHIYRPKRVLSADEVEELVRRHIFATRRVGLVGAALSDFPDLDLLCERLADEGYTLGLSSFRIDRLTPRLLRALARAEVHSISLAPEAGSERLRMLINKRITDSHIDKALALVAEAPLEALRLYFMIGLPGETHADLEAIVRLVRQAAGRFLRKGTKRQITVSINALIPKAWTVFQWAAVPERKDLQERRAYLEGVLRRIPGVKVRPKSVRQELLQAVFSLGGPEVGEALSLKVTKGLSWPLAFAEAGLDWRALIHQPRTLEQRFPWDIVDSGLDRAQLWRRWHKLQSDALSPSAGTA
ncbi:MAG: B12-binding domain-containing radical SAM protein [candidate division KSB1 bacterium]|nr:B12-binding domain-containing radical SAM protein [candidate division KSB1 bacterium]